MQPVTVSVPASARARSSASAVAAWSTSVAASSIERSANGSARRAGEQHHGLDLAAHGQRQQQRAAGRTGRGAEEREPRDAGGELVAVAGQEAAAGAATQLTPGGRSSRGAR